MTAMMIVYFGYAAVDILYDFSQKEIITKVAVERATKLKVCSFRQIFVVTDRGLIMVSVLSKVKTPPHYDNVNSVESREAVILN